MESSSWSSKPRMSARASTFLLGAVVAIVLATFFFIAGLKVPKAFKLGGCQSGTNVFQLITPKGDSFNLVLVGFTPSQGTWDSASENTNVLLSITVEDHDRTIYSRTLTAERVSVCNWMAKYGHPSAAIRTWPHSDTRVRLEEVLRAGDTYTVTLALKHSLTNEMSLWLHWLGWPRLSCR